MTLIINHDVISSVLTMAETVEVLEQAYADLVVGEAVCRPRIDIRIPTQDPGKNYQWGSMEGGSTRGYFAVRMKSDIIYETQYNGATTQEKYCVQPGTFCGLILLTSIKNGEPLAFINDGVLQHMRVGADGGIGVKHMSVPDAEVIGMLGSGGMARTHMQSFTLVRNIRKLKVFSPTPANREAFATEMRATYGIEVETCDRPELVSRGAHIIAGLTDSAVPVLDGACLEPGQHVVNIGGSGVPDKATMDRVDVYLRFGNAPAPTGRPEMGVDDEYIAYEARPDRQKFGDGKRKRGHGAMLPEKMVTLADILGGKKGRTDSSQITWSERGNLQGAQFFAVAGRAYERAREQGLGHEVPTDWFTQNIRN